MTNTNKARRRSRFGRGSGCYMCRACEFLTRETGKGESELALCAACYAAFCVEGKPGDEFGVSHGLMTEDAFFAKHGEHDTHPH